MPVFTDSAVCGIVSLTCSCSLAAVVQSCFSLLKYIIPEALPPSLMGLVLASIRSILELAGFGSV